MKKSLLFLLLSALLFVYSCSDDDNGGYQTQTVTVQLVYPADKGFEPQKDVTISLASNSTGATYEVKTDEKGKASFVLTAGIYDISATDVRTNGGRSFILNGSKSSFAIGTDWNSEKAIDLDLTVSTSGGIVIKELYVGGCQKDDASGAYKFDQYAILYNNSDISIDISNLAFGMVNPYNSNVSVNKDYENGVLFYESKGWIPAGMAVWYFTSSKVLASGEQLVVAFNNAVDNTTTYSNSINFANSSYYCAYDPESGFSNTIYYSSPSAAIPTSNYLRAYKFAQGNAWSLSQNSPAFFIFMPEGASLNSFVADAATTNAYGGSATQIRKMVPAEWVVDGVEVFTSGASVNSKRLTSTIDAGYISHTNTKGYTLYRNVDKAATEALGDNKDKIVYSYNLGTEGSTDVSNIDAEASIKKGARIIYKDTNNSSSDFHQRSRASLRN